jgi:hypothetical protein
LLLGLIGFCNNRLFKQSAVGGGLLSPAQAAETFERVSVRLLALGRHQ